jgi:uncharacterized membrane protein YeaQ/YmgE (transglycosylase-associated protein family)
MEKIRRMLRISYKYSRASRYFYFFVTLLFAAGFLALVVLVFAAVALVFTGAFFLAGAFVGGFIGSTLGFGSVTGFDIRSLLIAVGGSILLLIIYRAIKKNK